MEKEIELWSDSGVDQCNLEEAINRLNNFKTIKIMYGNTFAMHTQQLEQLQEDIETVLNYIENSIPKKKVEEKIKELANTKGDFATYIATSERMEVLKELLEVE